MASVPEADGARGSSAPAQPPHAGRAPWVPGGPDRAIHHADDEIAAINYVERVREAGPRSMPRGGENLRFSFGWSSPKVGEAPDSVVRRADTRLMAELLR